MQPTDTTAQNPKGNPVIRQYNHQTFRPEAVEAYATRQAGEPWNARHRWESLIIVVLTLAATAGVTFIFLGVH